MNPEDSTKFWMSPLFFNQYSKSFDNQWAVDNMIIESTNLLKLAEVRNPSAIADLLQHSQFKYCRMVTIHNIDFTEGAHLLSGMLEALNNNMIRKVAFHKWSIQSVDIDTTRISIGMCQWKFLLNYTQTLNLTWSKCSINRQPFHCWSFEFLLPV